MKRIKIFSFFAGAGFLDLGFERAKDFDVVFVNEYSPVFNKIYQYARRKMGIGKPRLGHYVCSIESLDTPAFSSQVNKEKQTSIVGFIGGPPCPDFSVAGKNKGRDGEHGKLSKTYVDLICKNMPDFFLFENVKGLYRTRKHREFFDELCEQLKDHQYLLTYRLVNAFEYGIAQDRDRLILIGIKKELADKLNKKYDRGQLTDFPWDMNKKSSREEVMAYKWPDCDEFIAHSEKEAPLGVKKELKFQ